MTPEKLLNALNDIDGQSIRDAHAEKQTARRGSSRRIAAVLAAVIALVAMTVTVFASAEIRGWFQNYFAQKTENGLTLEQIEYIEENEQTIAQASEQDGWTIELRSAINDGTRAYVIIGVTAPEDVSLEQKIVDDTYVDRFLPGNMTLNGSDRNALVVCSAGNAIRSYGYKMEEDGDGLSNTKNLVIQIDPNFDQCPEPFASDVKWYVFIEDFVHEYEDEEYRQELLNGKYAGQTEYMFTSEETDRLYGEEVLAEGSWKFSFTFAESNEGVELLSQPITISARVWDQEDPDDIADGKQIYKNVTVTSFALNALTAVIECDETSVNFDDMYVVMKDGSQILLRDTGTAIEAETPIILDNVDYVLMADGTKLMAP